MRSRAFSWLLFLAWAGFAPFVLLRPVEGLPIVPWLFQMELPRIDLLGHAALFWLGARLAVRALVDRSRSWRWVCGAVTSVALYGVLLEALQYYVPGRSLQLSDLGANLVGALLVASPLPWVGTRRGSSPDRPSWARA